MLRWVLWSALGLVMVWLVAQSVGLTPAEHQAVLMLAELNREEGDAFRRSEAQRSGVARLADGALVQVLRQGQGRRPDPDSWVRVHYRGQHIDGREFDNTWRRRAPASIPIDQAIPGWRAVLPNMNEGSRIRLVLPPELGYGRAGSGPIGPDETLIFELELLEVLESRLPGVIESS